MDSTVLLLLWTCSKCSKLTTFFRETFFLEKPKKCTTEKTLFLKNNCLGASKFVKHTFLMTKFLKWPNRRCLCTTRRRSICHRSLGMILNNQKVSNIFFGEKKFWNVKRWKNLWSCKFIHFQLKDQIWFCFKFHVSLSR